MFVLFVVNHHVCYFTFSGACSLPDALRDFVEQSKGVGHDDARCIAEFTRNALKSEDPFKMDISLLDCETIENIQWRKSVSNKEAFELRERIVTEIEARGQQLWKDGTVTEWFRNADPLVKDICRDVNAPLMTELANKIDYNDKSCVECFREGAQLAGVLPDVGGDKCKGKATMNVEELRKTCRHRNEQTIRNLKADKHAEFLLEEIIKDTEAGRMSGPYDVEACEIDNIVIAKRFAVEQGVKDDGSIKKRAIDDETASGVNMCTEGGDKIICHSIDVLMQAIKLMGFREGGFKKLSLWKADIKSAYRRIPIRPADRWLAWVALVIEGQVKVARHNSMMFGSRGSVVAWNRIGEFVRAIARKMLRVSCFRWVDDYFGVEPEATTEHVKCCFARVVRALMGPDTIETKKLEHGNPITILGIDIKIGPDDVTMWPTERKVQQWTAELEQCCSSGKMSSGLASKFAGRLNFATQSCFKKFGRAMVRPFYAQQYAPTRDGRCNPALSNAIKWWIQTFRNNLTQKISLKHKSKVVDMFCDASGSPPVLAAILCDKRAATYCVMDAPCWAKEKLQHRNDEQIMAYEILAIMMGLETFSKDCKRATIRVWTDNIGGECALRKKSSAALDHNLFVHLIWEKAANLNAGLWIDRVPSKLNIADGPTRPTKDIGLSILNYINAKKVQARLPVELRKYCDFMSMC